MRGRPGTRRGSKSAKKSTRGKAARTRTGRAAVRKSAKKTTKKKAPAKKKITRRAAAPGRKKSAAKKSPARKTGAKRTAKRAARKEVFGEGNYTASREFRDQETNFVRRNRKKIKSMGEEARAALEGNEGEELEAAEDEARSHSHSPGD